MLSLATSLSGATILSTTSGISTALKVIIAGDTGPVANAGTVTHVQHVTLSFLLFVVVVQFLVLL